MKLNTHNIKMNSIKGHVLKTIMTDRLILLTTWHSVPHKSNYSIIYILITKIYVFTVNIIINYF